MLSAPDEIPAEDDCAFQPWPQTEKDTRPLLVIPDSHGRVRIWHYLKTLPYWRGGIALCSKSTPPEHLAYLDARHITRITAGDTHVDMHAALAMLCKVYGIKILRMDSGGTLNGIMLSAGLVNEISLLIHPQLVGSADAKSFLITHQPCAVRLELIGIEKRASGLVWLRYKVPANPS